MPSAPSCTGLGPGDHDGRVTGRHVLRVIREGNHMICVTTAHPAALAPRRHHDRVQARGARITRQAAERLADIAFALTAGETLELRAGSERLRVRVADGVLLRRRGKATGDHVSVELGLSWPA